MGTMGQEGNRASCENGGRKRKIEDETCAGGKRACLENETCLEYLGGESHGIAVLSINRPSARNALSWKLVEDLQAALDDVCVEEDVRCLVLTSLVQCVFCAGADLKERALMSNENVVEFLKRLNHLVIALEELPVPVI